MPNRDKLLHQALNGPASMRFADLCSLAEGFGFVLKNQEGSHRSYKLAGCKRMMNFQNDGGKAKPYQVKQLLAALREQELISE